jgi:3-hydroxyisobutyrate dehydrogenase-like beta-hydroxyacid dehydrogenase
MTGAAPVDLGFIGLGKMGSPIAERLLAPDIRLHVHDNDPSAVARLTELGAIGHSTAAAVADAAPYVFACLPSAEISEHVALGPDGVAAGGAVRVYSEMSTIGQQAVLRIARGLQARGIGMVDAPVSGGPAGARCGTLAIMAAGPDEAMALVAPWLGRMGSRVFTLGDTVGAAQTMKLVNNLVLANTMAGTFEAMVFGAKAGLDAATMVDVLNASTGCSLVTTDIVPRTVLSGTFDFGAATSILAKDVALGIEGAQQLGVPMWTLEQSARLWQFAMAQGYADRDMTRLLTMIASWADVPETVLVGRDGV